MKDCIVDDFTNAASWLAVASGQARLQLTSEPGVSGPALRLDFDFKGGGGFIGARKDFALRLPEAYAFAFQVRGIAPKNKLEFKLADRGGQNVWRWQEEAFAFQPKPQALLIKSSEMEFAWGPAGGGTLRNLGPVEFIISAGPGGKGTIWLEQFRFLDRTCRKAPAVTASASARGCCPESVLDPKAGIGWRSAPADLRPCLQLDFHQAREYGGLIIEWAPRPGRRSFVTQASADGKHWRVIDRVRSAQGQRSFLYLPKGESRFLRLLFEGPAGIRRLELQPFVFSKSLIDFAHAVAQTYPRGRFPRYLLRQQSFWTCSGSPDGEVCALLNEDGMFEPGKGTFSLEPFLYVDGKLITWADATRSVRLEKSGLAIPSVRWRTSGLLFETTAFATGHGADTVQFVRYRLANSNQRSRRASLLVTVRPFQVTPPWQAWHGLGGLSPIKDIRWTQGAVRVNRCHWVIPLSRPSATGMATFEQGGLADYLAEGKLPSRTHASDPRGLASGAMQFDLTIAGQSYREVYIAVPSNTNPGRIARQARPLAIENGPDHFAEAVRALKDRVGGVTFQLPPGVAREAAETFRTAAGHILINRDGPALQPGARRYTRSWIRDGAVMGAALLRIGDFRALPEFVRWYAPYQREDGFVPCCVDRSGPDWLVEHDSHGQLIYAVSESYRFTRDRDFLAEMWPRVRKAACFLQQLRAQRLTRAYKTPDKIARYGLLPESASHEGYLAHPVHSYWDDAWGLRGLKDAAAVAAELGHAKDARAFASLADSFRETFRASIRRVIKGKNLRYVPASVEWADFDPTATSNTIALLHDSDLFPARQLDETYAEFLREFRRKHVDRVPWNNYTAYEIRTIGALVRLGKRADALELLKFFLSDRRPRHWNQWPEISWRNPRSPGHLGDVPHTWIAAEYMLAFASLFAYEREADEALIIGAGLDADWLAAPGGIAIRGLPTWFGKLDLSMKQDPDGSLQVELGGELRMPRGGFVVRPPGKRSIRLFTVNGTSMPIAKAQEVVVRAFPARATLTFE